VRKRTRQLARFGTTTTGIGAGCWCPSTSDSGLAVRRYGAAANKPTDHALLVSIFNVGNLAQT
jgi:hypothetical protein